MNFIVVFEMTCYLIFVFFVKRHYNLGFEVKCMELFCCVHIPKAYSIVFMGSHENLIVYGEGLVDF